MTGLATARPFTAVEAREITDRIRGAATRLHDLLLEAYARGAWKALGYGSWREYATSELSISQSRAYRLLDQAKVIAAIQEAAGDEVDFSQLGKSVTARAAEEIKDDLPWVTETIAVKVAAGAEPAAAVREAVTESRAAQRDAFTPDEPEPTRPALVEDEPDIAEEQERRIAELERLVESLEKADAAAEIKRLSTMYAQLEGRLRQEMTTCTAAQEQSQRHAATLKKIRQELGVDQTQQIIPAIRALRGQAAA
jgi:hypothetical protein